MDATSDTTRQVDRPPQFAADTLRGDVRDALLTHIRSMETPWSKLSEAQQRLKIEAMDKAASMVVRRAVHIIAEAGFPSLDVRVSAKGKYGDGGIEMAVSTALSPANVSLIAEHGSGAAVLVFAEPGEFFGERRAARAQPDQGAMDLDEGEDEGIDARPLEGIAAHEAWIDAAASLSGLTFLIEQWPEDRRAEVAARIRAKGGGVIGVVPGEEPVDEAKPDEGEVGAQGADVGESGDWHDGAEAEDEAALTAPAPKAGRRNRRQIRETEAA